MKCFLYVNSVSRQCLRLRDTALEFNFPFDMCIWLVEGEDVEGIHEVLAKHQQAFVEAVGIAAAAIAQASAAGSQGGPSNLQRFRAHHPPTFTGGGDPMVADHWFMQIEKVLEAMEIASDTTRIRLVQERSRGLLVHVGSRAAVIQAKDRLELPIRLGRWYVTIASSPDISGGIAPRTGIPGFWDNAVPVIDRIRKDTVYSFTSWYRPEEPISVSGSCTGTSCYTDKLERPGYGPRQRTRPTCSDVRGSGACLSHHTTG